MTTPSKERGGNAVRGCDNCSHKEKTDQEKPCCFCGGGNPHWEPSTDSDKKRNISPEESVIE